jgi:hypothetical protein
LRITTTEGGNGGMKPPLHLDSTTPVIRKTEGAGTLRDPDKTPAIQLPQRYVSDVIVSAMIPF